MLPPPAGIKKPAVNIKQSMCSLPGVLQQSPALPSVHGALQSHPPHPVWVRQSLHMVNGPTKPGQGLIPGVLRPSVGQHSIHSENLLSSQKSLLWAVTHPWRDPGKVKLASGATDEITCS